MMTDSRRQGLALLYVLVAVLLVSAVLAQAFRQWRNARELGDLLVDDDQAMALLGDVEQGLQAWLAQCEQPMVTPCDDVVHGRAILREQVVAREGDLLLAVDVYPLGAALPAALVKHRADWRACLPGGLQDPATLVDRTLLPALLDTDLPDDVRRFPGILDDPSWVETIDDDDLPVPHPDLALDDGLPAWVLWVNPANTVGIDVATAPRPILEQVYALLETDGLEAALEARRAGELPTVPEGNARQRLGTALIAGGSQWQFHVTIVVNERQWAWWLLGQGEPGDTLRIVKRIRLR